MGLAPGIDNEIAYKYLHPSRIDVLRDNRIRFTQPAALNDPFESNPIGDELRQSLIDNQKAILDHSGEQYEGNDLLEIRGAIGRNARKAVDNIIQNVRTNTGILSLSLNRSELLMWSHYCDSHRGVVVGFYGLHEYFQKGIPDKRGGLRPVEYSDTRPSLPRYEQFSEQDIAKIALFTKSTHWKYEEEFRMLHSVKYADARPGKDAGDHPVYLFDFPPETVVEVIMGCQMAKPLREEITALVKGKYQDARLFEAEMSKTTFDLVIKEM